MYTRRIGVGGGGLQQETKGQAADKMARQRTDQELAISIKKATNSDEISPKRKHVRACIVYTWDHRSAQAFWSGIKV